MVEYTYDEAVALLESNLATALDKQVCVCEREKGLRAMGFVLSYYLVQQQYRSWQFRVSLVPVV